MMRLAPLACSESGGATHTLMTRYSIGLDLGGTNLRAAAVSQDGKMLEVARQAAMRLVENDPTLAKPEHRGLLARVRERRSSMAVVTVS